MAATPAAPASGTAAEAFRRVYGTLKDELLRDPAFDFNEDAIQWLDGASNAQCYLPPLLLFHSASVRCVLELEAALIVL
jgi:hypothetical protein